MQVGELINIPEECIAGDVVKLADLLSLTETPRTTFNNMVRDGVLPFQPNRPGPRKRAAYSARDLLALDLAKTLFLAGVAWREAAHSIRGQLEDLTLAMRSRPADDDDVYLVRLTHPLDDADGVASPVGAEHIAFCSLLQLPAIVTEQAEIRSHGGKLQPPHTIIQVNVSERLRSLKARVKAQGQDARLGPALEAIWSRGTEVADAP